LSFLSSILNIIMLSVLDFVSGTGIREAAQEELRIVEDVRALS
jgi:hypothetical protein